MGAGKSTIGRQLAHKLGMTFFDSDKVIEERTGVSIPTIFAIEGEDGFREREEQIIAELSAMSGIVLATGGGSVLREVNRQHIRQSGGCVIYLKASAEQLFHRIKNDKTRPLMQTSNPLQTLRGLLKTREPFYLEVANLIIPTGKQKVNVILREINTKLKQLQDIAHANA